jgi:hypothetical protein
VANPFYPWYTIVGEKNGNRTNKALWILCWC